MYKINLTIALSILLSIHIYNVWLFVRGTNSESPQMPKIWTQQSVDVISAEVKKKNASEIFHNVEPKRSENQSNIFFITFNFKI